MIFTNKSKISHSRGLKSEMQLKKSAKRSQEFNKTFITRRKRPILPPKQGKRPKGRRPNIKKRWREERLNVKERLPRKRLQRKKKDNTKSY